MDIFFLIAGLGGLLGAAHYFVDSASSLARRLRVSTMVIGLTVVAFGTSAPEMIVNFLASVEGRSGIVLGNTIGSNILNICLILGVAALIHPLRAGRDTIQIEIPLVLLAATAVLVATQDSLLDRTPDTIGRGDGLLLILFFLVFLGYTLRVARTEEMPELDIRTMSLAKSIGLLLVSLLVLLISGKVIVDAAVSISRGLGISERVISLTVVSLGTSLPELATSVVAARRGHADMAVGNVVGSNIFNGLLIIGGSAVIAPVPLMEGGLGDLLMNLLVSLLLFLFLFTGRGRKIENWEGSGLLLMYAGYIGWLLI